MMQSKDNEVQIHYDQNQYGSFAAHDNNNQVQDQLRDEKDDQPAIDQQR